MVSYHITAARYLKLCEGISQIEMIVGLPMPFLSPEIILSQECTSLWSYCDCTEFLTNELLFVIIELFVWFIILSWLNEGKRLLPKTGVRYTRSEICSWTMMAKKFECLKRVFYFNKIWKWKELKDVLAETREWKWIRKEYFFCLVISRKGLESHFVVYDMESNTCDVVHNESRYTFVVLTECRSLVKVRVYVVRFACIMNGMDNGSAIKSWSHSKESVIWKGWYWQDLKCWHWWW